MVSSKKLLLQTWPNSFGEKNKKTVKHGGGNQQIIIIQLISISIQSAATWTQLGIIIQVLIPASERI